MLEINNISFSYNQNSTLKDISFNVKKGENIAIIRESGCGKSTLLKLIYGLYDLDRGEILFEKKTILGPKFNLIAGENYIKYLAQDFGLMPYITVAENVGKYLSNTNKKLKSDRINELLIMVEMSHFADIKAQYLSGGQQQRVAIAMVLANEPKILLLDEPFSQIDSFRKNNLRRNLFNYLKDKEIICLIATHDANDALSFSDQTIVLRNGEIVAKNHPKIMFENPKSKYIGSLFGEINEIVINGKLHLIYSHQLEIVTKSDIKVVAKQNYFRGDHYLIEVSYDIQILYFDSEFEIKTGTILFLQLK
ncbi:MAG: ABC transporter ATP-binding protein [Flavobacterium sp.]|nr:ABC transporter ATP-binding protein [Flavobacterium sp.]